MNVWCRRLAAGILLIGLSGSAAERSVANVADDSFFTHLHTEKAMANVTLSPARVGTVEIAIQLETVDETPLTAKAVSVTLTNADASAGPKVIEAERRGDDQWLARLSVPKAGRWTLGLGIAISDNDKVSIEAPVIIR